MGVALTDRRPTREAVHSTMEPSPDDMLEPEVLVLRADSRVNAVIMSDNKPDVPLYSLDKSMFLWPADDDPPLHSNTLYRNLTTSSLQAPPKAICILDRGLYFYPETGYGREYRLNCLGPNSVENTIELRPPTHLRVIGAPVSSAATWDMVQRGPPLLEAFVCHRVPRPIHAHPAAAEAGDDMAEELLFSTRLRWLSTTELNYLGADGRQLACEDRDYDENDSDGRPPRPTRRLVITVPMERRLRDALVGVWCLRIWREQLDVEVPRARGRRRRSSRGRGWAAEKDVGAAGAGVPGRDGRSKPRGEASLGQGAEGTRVPV